MVVYVWNPILLGILDFLGFFNYRERQNIWGAWLKKHVEELPCLFHSFLFIFFLTVGTSPNYVVSIVNCTTWIPNSRARTKLNVVHDVINKNTTTTAVVQVYIYIYISTYTYTHIHTYRYTRDQHKVIFIQSTNNKFTTSFKISFFN